MNGKIILFAILLVCLCSCSKTEVERQPATVAVSASADNNPDTRISFGALSGNTYPFVWNENQETIGVAEFLGNAKSQDVRSSAYNRIDASHARFELLLDVKDNAGNENFTYYAVTPAPASESGTHGWRSSETNHVVYVLNPTVSQVPAAGAPDESTHLMYAKATQIQKTQPTSLSLTFNPLVAYGKMTIKGFRSLAEGESVTMIEVSVPDSYKMAGTQKINVLDDTKSDVTDGTCYIHIDPKNIEMNTTAVDVWFTTFPFTLQINDQMVISVTTKVGDAQPQITSHTVTLSKALPFVAGQVSGFGVTFVSTDFQ